MKRREFIINGGIGLSLLTAVGLIAYETTDTEPPRKRCSGDCEFVDSWSFEWSSNGIDTDTLNISVIPTDDSPPLTVEFRGYGRGGDLSYANIFDIDGAETIVEHGAEHVERAQLTISVRNS